MEKISENEVFGKSTKLTLDDFSMISVIGKGSFAKVVLVKKNDTNELYALKVMKKKHIKKKNNQRTQPIRLNPGLQTLLMEYQSCL